jgi:hypothetical protein
MHKQKQKNLKIFTPNAARQKFYETEAKKAGKRDKIP